VAAAAVFGLAHLYQKVTGVVATAIAGLLFCVLYVKTGSLLLPILLHVAIDVRFAFLPALRTANTQTAYA
jgi:membrane protease YdiL (CAAX protease family)